MSTSSKSKVHLSIDLLVQLGRLAGLGVRSPAGQCALHQVVDVEAVEILRLGALRLLLRAGHAEQRLQDARLAEPGERIGPNEIVADGRELMFDLGLIGAPDPDL
jgi:hypothetical protein